MGRMAMEMNVQGRRKRGRPTRRWLDRVRNDMTELHRSVCHRTSTSLKSGNKMKRKTMPNHDNVPAWVN